MSTSGKKAIHFGGGNIGRGFVAEFLHKSGYEVVFVDVQEDLIKQLQETKSYTVTEIGIEGEHSSTIDNYRAINSKDEESKVVDEIASADVVTCAVGPNVLKFIAPVIAKGIDGRTKDSPLTVIACENMIGGTDTLKGYVADKIQSKDSLDNKAIFANSAIDRIVPAQDPDAGLNVKIEKFYEWCVETKPWKQHKPELQHPDIKGVHFVDDLEPFIERKLYTVNTSHATAAYFGHYHGKHTIHDAMSDDKIKSAVREAVKETAHLIVNKHGITKQDQEDYVEKIIKRISNPHLEDVVERVGRAPIRKLGKQERFIGPASQLLERGDKIDGLLAGAEMCFRFTDVEDDEESVKLANLIKEKSAEEVVLEVTGLDKDHNLVPLLVKIVQKLQGEKSKGAKGDTASASL